MSGQTLDNQEKNAGIAFGFFSPCGAFGSGNFSTNWYKWPTEVCAFGDFRPTSGLLKCVQFPAVPVFILLPGLPPEAKVEKIFCRYL